MLGIFTSRPFSGAVAGGSERPEGCCKGATRWLVISCASHKDSAANRLLYVRRAED
jgi:hypothetical protein